VAAGRDTEYLVIDIETVPDTARWRRPESPEGVGAPFPPTWAHRVIAIGGLWLDRDYRLTRLGVIAEDVAGSDERALLLELSRLVGASRPQLVTYNGRAFDLPVIALRALCHGVPLGWYYEDRAVRDRYREDGHLDLCDWLADHGATRSGSLDALARLIGLPGKTGVDGSQVEGLFRSGQLATIQRYCLADVVQTGFLFLRFQLLRGLLPPADHAAAARGLLEALRADGRSDDVLDAIDEAQLLACVDAGAKAGAGA
jgi:3'-5' exonuclease